MNRGSVYHTLTFLYALETVDLDLNKKRTPAALAAGVFAFLRFLKRILVQSANGANEVGGEIFPLGARRDAVLGVALDFVVFVAAGANVFHLRFPLISQSSD